MSQKSDELKSIRHEIEDELKRLERLKDEGKPVDEKLNKYRILLNHVTDEEIDANIDNESKDNMEDKMQESQEKQNVENGLEKKMQRVSDELQKIKSEYSASTVNLRRTRAENRRLKSMVAHYEKDDSLTDRIVTIVRNAIESLPPIEPPVQHVPDNTNKKEESMLLLLSDVHVGKKTKSYNSRVFVKRLNVLKEGLFDIVDMHRKIRRVDKLYIVFNGDIIDAESIYPGQAVDGIDAVILDQLYTVGLPAFVNFLQECSAYFPQVECHCVKGNHGKQNAAKWSSSKSTNWDNIFYRTLETVFSTQNQIKWFIPTFDWKDMFKIYNEGFLVTHGNMIKMYYNLPDYGMSRQSMRWANAYRNKIKLTHFMFGHFHSLNAGKRFNQIIYYGNGSFVTDDDFAEENLGVYSKPEQLLVGIHPTKGVTWRYPMHLN